MTNNNTLNVPKLAEEFGTSEKVMRAFIERFAPQYVAAGQLAEGADTMLFVHIPKTAGMSVGKSFRLIFDNFYGVQWDDIGLSFRRATRQAAYKQSHTAGRQVIMGHFGWPELMMWRNHEMTLKCGTIFREPTARFVSNYKYNCSNVHPGRDAFVKRFPTLESYVDQEVIDVQLTQAIGIISSFEEALVKLTKYYTFLGVTERLAASLDHLSNSHGLRKAPVHRENVGAQIDAPISAKILARVREHSHNDMKLHRLLITLYGN